MALIDIVPSAPALLGSLRGLGYTPESAVADLIDNSIAAGATQVDLSFDWNDGQPWATIADDGCGMDRAQLIEAMRFGGAGPRAQRDELDLGRFGLGLKTASLSQCRCLTVASAREGSIAAICWDLDHVEKCGGRWEARLVDPESIGGLFEAIGKRGQGTLIQWTAFDTSSGFDIGDRDSFLRSVEAIQQHVGMVFHRFLGGDARHISIRMNGRVVRAWDPFLETHPATIATPEERLRAPQGTIRVRGFVMPHRDKFPNEEQYLAAGGPQGWNAQQGIHVYRGKRLVVAGGWLGLGGARAWTRDESSKLARIRVDIPPAADAAWRIDVRKSTARPPGSLRRPLQRIAEDSRRLAREVFVWRGNRGQSRTAATPVQLWERREAAGGHRYAIRRNHPLVQALHDAIGGKAASLERLLSAIEWSVPVERVWLDVSETGVAHRAMPEEAQLEVLARAAIEIANALGPRADTAKAIEGALQFLPQHVCSRVCDIAMRLSARGK